MFKKVIIIFLILFPVLCCSGCRLPENLQGEATAFTSCQTTTPDQQTATVTPDQEALDKMTMPPEAGAYLAFFKSKVLPMNGYYVSFTLHNEHYDEIKALIEAYINSSGNHIFLSWNGFADFGTDIFGPDGYFVKDSSGFITIYDTVISETKVFFDMGRVEGPTAGMGYGYMVEKKDDVWEITETGGTWVS